MYPDGSQCPEDSNSTDCLLRTLLEFLKKQQEVDDNEIDWDPINFAFTLLIGLLAIFFALATILQAIFAAGKGRRRTNHLAIGQWSQKTTRKWNWSEMNFQFTASTPILREDSLPAMPSQSRTTEYRNCDPVDGKGDKDHADGEPAQDSTKSSHMAVRPRDGGLMAYARKFASKIHPSQSRHPSAAWLGLFEEVGLDKLDCQVWGDSVRDVAADYLPDDLVAAPAYAQIGAIVAAAATAGIQKLHVDQQNYPILLGQGFQVDFRQHPALGVVGAYSRYDKPSKQSSSLNLEELRSAMRYGRGIIEAEISIDLATNSTKRQVIERWNTASKSLAVERHREKNSSIFVLKLPTNSEVYLPLMVGLSAFTPKRVPAVFPTTSIGASLPLTALALNGKYWAKARLDKFNQSHILKWPTSQATPIWHGVDWFDFRDPITSPEIERLYIKLVPSTDFGTSNLLKLQLEASELEAYLKSHAEAFTPEPEPKPESKPEPKQEPKPSKEHTKASKWHRIVLHMCLKLLCEPNKLEEWFFEASPDVQRVLRCIVLAQMKEVDQWLRERQADVKSQSIVLCNTSIVLLQADQMVVDGELHIFPPNAPLSCIGRLIENPGRNTNGEQPESNTARGIHFKMLQALRGLMDSPDGDLPGAEKLRNLVELHRAFPISRLWDRLGTIVVYHFEEEPHWPLWDQFHEVRDHETGRDIDDVIIYRCLMIILLLRTAADSSKILESGLWDKIVPII